MRVFRHLFPLAILLVPSLAFAWTPPPYQTQWGEAGAGAGQFNTVGDVAVDASGNVYVSDLSPLQRIQKFDAKGNFLTSWDATNATQIAMNTNGNLLVVIRESGFSGVREYTTAGAVVRQWSYSAITDPGGIVVDASGSIYVSDRQTDEIYKFAQDGSFLLSFGGLGSTKGKFVYPGRIAIDGQGLLYVVDYTRVQIFDSQGVFHGLLGSTNPAAQPGVPMAVAVDKQGYVYVTDDSGDRVVVYRAGGYVAQWGAAGSGPGQFQYPRGIAVGPGGLVYVGDMGNARVEKFGLTLVPTEAVTLGHVKAIYRGERITTP